MLEQVTINAQNAGEVEIQLQDSSGEVLEAAIVSVTSGVQTVDLNFMVPVANNLRLVGVDFSTGGLYRNNSGISYPYSNGSISIKDSSAGTSYYYFFYDWKIGSIKSPRKEVVVTVNPSPDANFTYTVNPSENGEVTFTNTSTNATSYSWNFGDGIGTSTDANPVYMYASSGTYSVTLTSTNAECGDNTETIQIPVTVNSLGITNSSINDIAVFPNPFKDAIDIQLPSGFDRSNIKIILYDIRGRAITTDAVYHNNLVRINSLKSLSSGSFLLKIADVKNGNNIIKKLIKY